MIRPTEIIAEIANAHDGNTVLAARLARLSLSSGADAVKFQVYFPEELLTPSHPQFAEFQTLAFSKAEWRALLSDFSDVIDRVYCDVFGLKSLDIVLEYGVRTIKIHVSDLGNTDLLRAVAATGARTLLSCGGATGPEIASALAHFTSDSRPTLLAGFQNYPTPPQDAQLRRLSWLRETFDTDVGYMDHTDGESLLVLPMCAMALALGASSVEKHVTLDRAARGSDYESASEPHQLASFVRQMRELQAALGEPFALSEGERAYSNAAGKVWVPNRPIQAGEVLSLRDLRMLRAKRRSGQHAARRSELENRAVRCSVPAFTALSCADVDTRVVAAVVVRSASSRLPEKAKQQFAGMTALDHLLMRLRAARRVDQIVVCTTCEPEDDWIPEAAAAHGLPTHRGHTSDVLQRILGSTVVSAADVVVRATADNILVDPAVLDAAVEHHLQCNADYTCVPGVPDGMDFELYSRAALAILDRAADTAGSEYLSAYVRQNEQHFRMSAFSTSAELSRPYRLTIDTAEDARVVATVLEAMRASGKQTTYTLADVVEFLDRHGSVAALNDGVEQRTVPSHVDTTIHWNALTSLKTEDNA